MTVWTNDVSGAVNRAGPDLSDGKVKPTGSDAFRFLNDVVADVVAMGTGKLDKTGDASDTTVQATGATYARSAAAMAADVTNVLSYILPGYHAAIVAGTSTVDVSAGLQAALNKGREVYLPYSVTIAASVTLGVPGTRLYGPGTIKLAAGFDADEAIRVTAAACTVEGITVDGLPAQITAIRSYSLLRAIQGVSSGLTLLGLTLQGSRGAGVIIGESATITRNVTLDNCRITETGWSGVVLFNVQGGGVKNCDIDKTGENSIAKWGACATLDISANRLSKAEAPAYIYDGPGSLGGVHAGGWIRLSPGVPDTPDDGGHQISITKNWCYDCSTTGSDGFVMGEHPEGSEFGTHIITENYLIKPGGWGIDVGSNMIVDRNWIIEPGSAAMLIGQDYGGKVRNTSVTSNIFINAPSGFDLTANLATSIEYENIRVAGNKVIDTRDVPECLYAVQYNSSNATFENVVFEDNDFSGAATAVNRMAGTTTPSGLIFRRNQLSTPIHAVSGGSFSVLGYDTFLLTNASPTNLTGLIGGHIGQEVLIQFGDANTTVVFNYGGSVVSGVQPLWGNGNVSQGMRQNDFLRCRCMGTWWNCEVISTGSRGTVVAGLVDGNAAYLTALQEWPVRITSGDTTPTHYATHILQRRTNNGGATADTAYLGGICWGGHTGSAATSGFDGGAVLTARAIGGWTSTSTGTTVELKTTPYGSTTPVKHIEFTHDGLTLFPRTLTTGSAGNAYLDAGGSNALYRSTSSLRYKTDVEDLDLSTARKLLNLRPITYRSLAAVDDKTKTHLGLIAEEVNEVESRLVHFTKDGNGNLIPDGVQYDRVVVGLLSLVKDMEKRLSALESR